MTMFQFKGAAAVGVMILGLSACQSPTEPGAWDSLIDQVVPFDPELEGQRAFIEDFNFDGRLDVLRMGDEGSFGNAGGPFDLFLGADNGAYRYVGGIGAHPLAVHLKKVRSGHGKISVYWRSGADGGAIGTFNVVGGSVREGRGEAINPNDSGTEEDQAKYWRFFHDGLGGRLELLEAVRENGQVVWKQFFQPPPPFMPQEQVEEMPPVPAPPLPLVE